MPLVNLVIALIIVGVLLWAINRFIPMAGSIKTILNVVVVVACAFGFYNPPACGGRCPAFESDADTV